MKVTKKLFVPIIKTCAQFILYLRKRNVVTNSPRTGLVCLVPLLPKYTQIFFLQLLLNYEVFRLFVGSRMRWILQLWAASTLDTLHGLQMPWRRSFTRRISTTGFVSPILRDIKWSNEINQRQRAVIWRISAQFFSPGSSPKGNVLQRENISKYPP